MLYHPGESPLSQAPLIGLQEPHLRGEGGAANASHWIKLRPSKWRREGERAVEEFEPEGWFKQLCDRNGLAWFFPFVVRLAEGERVETDEIRTAYAAHSRGKPIIEGTIWQIYDALREMNPRAKP